MPKKKSRARAASFDVVVIGGGSAGFSAAEAAAARGKKVCIIERERLGGECPNWACVPTKALLRSAKLYHQTKRLSSFGVKVTGASFRFSDIMRRKDAVVEAISGKGKKLERIAAERGITILKGAASFQDAHTLKVGQKRIKGESIVLATGTVGFIPPIDGIEKAGYLTFRDAVSLKRQPTSMVIVGGGPVGCEFATFFTMLGTKVTLIQLSSQVLHREDPDVAAIAQKQLAGLGVTVLTRTKTLSVRKEGRKRRVAFQRGQGKRQTVLVDHVLVAAGKRANLDGLHVEKAGVQLGNKGRLQTNAYQQTNVKHIFAAGDVDGGMQFTHTAHTEGAIVGYNATLKTVRGMKKRDMRVVPRVTFVHPEVASVGMTLFEARAAKKKVEAASYPVGALGRSVTEGERTGLLKVIVEKKTEKILGGHMIGACAGEVIHEIALSMKLGAKAKDVAGMIHAFPTHSEVIAAALARYE